MASIDLRGRDLITTQEWTREELDAVLEKAKELKQKRQKGNFPHLLKDKTFFMLFYNTSTRTRASFEAAMTDLGGHAQFLEPGSMRLGEGESLKDTALTLSRYGHGIGIRILEKAVDYVYGRGNQVLREYAKWANIPIINMADDKFHPCQALTDIMTVQEKFPKIQGKKFVFSWAYSHHARSWCSVQSAVLLAARYGMETVLAHPPGFELDPEIMDWCQQNAQESGGSFEITNDVKSAYNGAHVVYPRSWVSAEASATGIDKFGVEKEAQLHDKYRDWMATSELMDLTSKDGVYMHCLPVFRGEEATDEVVDSAQSVIFDQAENRLHLQKGLLALVMSD